MKSKDWFTSGSTLNEVWMNEKTTRKKCQKLYDYDLKHII